MKLRETTPNMSFGPRHVRCKKRTKGSGGKKKLVLCMHPDTRFRNG
jgi:hypothetical protein